MPFNPFSLLPDAVACFALVSLWAGSQLGAVLVILEGVEVRPWEYCDGPATLESLPF